jgi:hypothetical protein
MTPEQVLSYKPNVLTQRQRESYFESGYLLLERIIPTEIVERLRRATAEKVDEARSLTKSDAVWDSNPIITPIGPNFAGSRARAIITRPIGITQHTRWSWTSSSTSSARMSSSTTRS